MSAGNPRNSDGSRSTRDEPTGQSGPEPAAREEQGFWSAYWERFRCQQVDDPVDDRREGMWDRFRRQDVDAPVRGGRT